MGIVYLCCHVEKNIPVAIKTFQDWCFQTEEAIDRFIWEAEAWVRLEGHENIVRAICVQKIALRPYIFLEMITGDEIYGPDLTGWISKKGLDTNTTLSFAIQFCLGMEHAESKFKKMGKPFVHRDIKPANIMVTKNKKVKITDFGLVKTFLGYECDMNTGITGDASTGDANQGFYSNGTICGSPAYMSPEQFIGADDIDIRSDIYSFGCVLYEMLTGRGPFKCYTIDSYKDHHLSVKPNMPNELSSDVPKELNDIVMRCLEKEPGKRYRDFKALREELSEVFFKDTRERFIRYRTSEGIDDFFMFAITEYGEYVDIMAEGEALSSLGKHDEAANCFDKALKLHLKVSQAEARKIFDIMEEDNSLPRVDKREEDVDHVENPLNYNPKPSEAWDYKDSALANLVKNEEAVDYMKDFESLAKGTALSVLGKHKEAIDCFDKAIKINPVYAEAWNRKGSALASLGIYDEAIDCFDKAIKINPMCAEAWNDMGSCLEGGGKYETAIKCFDKAIELQPMFAEAWYGKGICLLSPDKYEEAIYCFERAIDINPMYAEAWDKKGDALSSLSRHEKAIDCCDNAIKINPMYAEAWFNKGIILVKIGKHKEAADALRIFVKYAPRQYAPQFARAYDMVVQIAKKMIASLESL